MKLTIESVLKAIIVWALIGIAGVLLCTLFDWPRAWCVVIGTVGTVALYWDWDRQYKKIQARGVVAVVDFFEQFVHEKCKRNYIVNSATKTAIAFFLMDDTKEIVVAEFDLQRGSSKKTTLCDPTIAVVSPVMDVVDLGSRTENIATGWALGGSTGAWLGATKPSGEMRTVRGVRIVVFHKDGQSHFLLPTKKYEEYTLQWAEHMIDLINGWVKR